MDFFARGILLVQPLGSYQPSTTVEPRRRTHVVGLPVCCSFAREQAALAIAVGSKGASL
jgi:hypothetical protein